MKNKGFTLLEIFIATAMLSLVTIGLANIFLTCKRLIVHVRERVAAAELAKYYLDPLYLKVSEGDWDAINSDYAVGHPLRAVTNAAGAAVNLPIGLTAFTTFTPFYTITPMGDARMRKVVLNITWSEPQ